MNFPFHTLPAAELVSGEKRPKPKEFFKLEQSLKTGNKQSKNFSLIFYSLIVFEIG